MLIASAESAAAAKLSESFFQISNDSLRDVQNSMNNETQSSITEATAAKLADSIGGKRRRLDDEGNFMKISLYDENAIAPKKLIDLPIMNQAPEKKVSVQKSTMMKAGTPIKQKPPTKSEMMSTAKKSTAKKL